MNLGLVSPYDQLIIFHSCELSFSVVFDVLFATHLDKNNNNKKHMSSVI